MRQPVTYEDGCAAHDECVSCPFPRCLYEVPREGRSHIIIETLGMTAARDILKRMRLRPVRVPPEVEARPVVPGGFGNVSLTQEQWTAVSHVVRRVSRDEGMTLEEMLKPTREYSTVHARHHLIYELARLSQPKLYLTEIGELLAPSTKGGTPADHSTIINGAARYADRHHLPSQRIL